MGRPELALVGDVGGSKIIIGVASAEGVLDSEEIVTPQDADEVFNKVGGLAVHFLQQYDIQVGGIGWPGPADMVDGHAIVGPFQNIPGLTTEAYDINERLAAVHPRLRDLKVLGLNDAEAQTHEAPYVIENEDTEGQVITFFTHSTGIGGDSIIDGVVVSRASHTLAEYGQIPFRQPTGSYQTLENRVSGRAIKTIYGHGVLEAKELAAMEKKRYIWNPVGTEFARGISTVVPIMGTRHLVIGGGVSRAHKRYENSLTEELDKAVRVIPDHLVKETPKIHFVPEDQIGAMGLKGAFRAIQERYEELAAA